MNWFATMMHWLNEEPPSPLPAHVQAVKIDEKVWMHILEADRPSPRTQAGFVKPRTE